jgi:hypothetical protein
VAGSNGGLTPPCRAVGPAVQAVLEYLVGACCPIILSLQLPSSMPLCGSSLLYFYASGVVETPVTF